MHNGWTNYATWRINLEIFDDIDSEHWAEEIEDLRGNESKAYKLGNYLQNYVEELFYSECESDNNLTYNYALAFINDVNWSEIAEHIIESYEDNYCCDNCNDRIDERYMKSFCSERCEKEYWLVADHPKG